MVKIKQIKVDNQDLINLLERLQYETDSKKEVISYMISTDSILAPSFETYEKRYEEAFIQYTVAKQELENTYVFPAFENKSDVISWNLDFATHIIEVKYTE